MRSPALNNVAVTLNSELLIVHDDETYRMLEKKLYGDDENRELSVNCSDIVT